MEGRKNRMKSHIQISISHFCSECRARVASRGREWDTRAYLGTIRNHFAGRGRDGLGVAKRVNDKKNYEEQEMNGDFFLQILSGVVHTRVD